jgi:hypothetical protein
MIRHSDFRWPVLSEFSKSDSVEGMVGALARAAGISTVAPIHDPATSLGDTLGIASAAIGLVGLIIAAIFFWWHLRELKRTEAKTELNLSATQEVGRQTLAALKLHDAFVGDEHLENVVQDLARHYVRLSKHKDELATFLAGRELDDIARFMTMGAEGYITVGSDAFAHADRLGSALLRTAGAGDEFWASSLVAPEFWSHATAYLGQQAAKAAAGVTIHRVFVFDTLAAFHDARAQSQMTLQTKDGIKVRYVIDPPYDMRDLVVVRKSESHPGKTRNIKSMKPTYAMECRVGPDKRIDHIDLWTSYGLHSTRVDETWWNLDGIFKQSHSFKAAASVAPAAPAGGAIPFPERRVTERRVGERRSGDRRRVDRRQGDRRHASEGTA